MLLKLIQEIKLKNRKLENILFKKTINISQPLKSTSCLATESLENKLTKFLYGCGIPFNVVRSSNYEEMIDVDITYGL